MFILHILLFIGNMDYIWSCLCLDINLGYQKVSDSIESQGCNIDNLRNLEVSAQEHFKGDASIFYAEVLSELMKAMTEHRNRKYKDLTYRMNFKAKKSSLLASDTCPYYNLFVNEINEINKGGQFKITIKSYSTDWKIINCQVNYKTSIMEYDIS